MVPGTPGRRPGPGPGQADETESRWPVPYYAKALVTSPAPSPEEVSSALRQRLAGRFPGEVADVEVPVRVTGGFDFWIYGLRFGGAGLPAQWTAPLIARIPAAAERFVLDAGTVWVIDWTDAGIGDRHGDIARTEWLFRFAAVALTGEAGRAVHQALPALSRDYLPSYRRELPVDAARLRLWMPLQHLDAWAVAVAGQQGFFGPSHPGNDSRIATWAEEQFRLSIEDLP
jgi:hypothetical protein